MKFYPHVPQLMTSTPDDPDGNLFYVIKYGARYTAMPGWDGVLSDDDIWKTVDLHQEFRADEGQLAAAEAAAAEIEVDRPPVRSEVADAASLLPPPWNTETGTCRPQ